MDEKTKKMISLARDAKKESKQIEFKSTFDPSSSGSWCEILKDLVAMLNSGGGLIIFGVNDDGSPSDFDKKIILELDPAKITDKVEKYTGDSFSDFEITTIKRSNRTFAALLVNGLNVPIIFSETGTYKAINGKDKNAFSKGMLYLRHGAKSSPANTKDIQLIINNEVKRQRAEWFGNVRKLANAPLGHEIRVLPPGAKITNDISATPIRITSDKNAQEVRMETPDKLYPHRQRDVIERFNKESKIKKAINQFDIRCVKGVYDIEKKPEYFYKSELSGMRQYNTNFIDLLLQKYKEDSDFFINARKVFKERNIGKTIKV